MTIYSSWAFSKGSSPNSASYVIDGKPITYYNDVRWKWVITEKVNNADNTSTFVVDKYAVFYYTWADNPGSINISSRSRIPSNATWKSESKAVPKSTSSSSYTYIGQDSFTVSHDSDGSGSTTYALNGYYTGGSGTQYSQSKSGSITMTNIPRVSSLSNNTSASARKDLGTSVTFSITRKSNAFTHTLNYTVGSTTYTIGTGIETSVNYTFPTSLVSSFPKTATPNITVKCLTYNGSTKVGETTTVVYLGVPASYVPTASLSLIDVGNIPSGWNIFIKGQSNLQGTITANGIEGSTIDAYLTSANGNTYSTSIFLTGLLKFNGERSITATVTDSRGRSASDTVNFEVVDYIVPTIASVKVERCLEDGTLDEDGTYGKATITYKIAPVTKGGTNLNAKGLKVSCGGDEKIFTPTNYEGAYTFNTLFENLETNAKHTFMFTIKDTFNDFGVISQEFTMTPSFTTMSALAGGYGITLGQIAVEEGFISHFDNKFYKNTKAKNISIEGLKTEKLSENNWIMYVEDDD